MISHPYIVSYKTYIALLCKILLLIILLHSILLNFLSKWFSSFKSSCIYFQPPVRLFTCYSFNYTYFFNNKWPTKQLADPLWSSKLYYMVDKALGEEVLNQQTVKKCWVRSLLFPRYLYCTSMVFLSFFYCISIELLLSMLSKVSPVSKVPVSLLYFYGIFIILLLYFHGTSIVLLWYFYHPYVKLPFTSTVHCSFSHIC